jgi:hypothetical protein
VLCRQQVELQKQQQSCFNAGAQDIHDAGKTTHADACWCLMGQEPYVSVLQRTMRSQARSIPAG